MNFRESLVSAHHNYLVNGLLTPGFVLGEPSSEDGFWFLADMLLPGECTPWISGRLFDQEGKHLLLIIRNEIIENPEGYSCRHRSGGLRILHPSGEPILSVHTRHFANGYLTRLEGRLYDEEGKPRMEPFYGGVQIHGEARLALGSPFSLSSERPVVRRGDRRIATDPYRIC